jgi:hypothetical protein
MNILHKFVCIKLTLPFMSTVGTCLENGYRLQIKFATVAIEKWEPMACTGAMTHGRGLGMDFFYPEYVFADLDLILKQDCIFPENGFVDFGAFLFLQPNGFR